jgi:UDPglucose 6-dehydrogenase
MSDDATTAAAKPRIGFIGQGFIGKHMADDYEARGYETVRYSLEEPYIHNEAALQDCSIVFVAVPTPTTPQGFDSSIVRSALGSVPAGAVAVIKSTIVPGTTAALQQSYPDITVMHSPEFLREKTAAEDTAHPERNIIGITDDSPELRAKAEQILETLPDAPYSHITLSVNAECVKYIGNTYLYAKLLFMNLAYDYTLAAGADWDTVRTAVSQDSRIGASHTQPVNDGGRGAGGHCFIKDFETFLETFTAFDADEQSVAVLKAMRAKNNQLLTDSEKDMDLLRGVYGDNIPIR